MQIQETPVYHPGSNCRIADLDFFAAKEYMAWIMSSQKLNREIFVDFLFRHFPGNAF